MKISIVLRMLIVLVLFQFFQTAVRAESIVFGVLTTDSGEADYQYGPSPGIYTIYLSDFQAIAPDPPEQKFIKIANDIAAISDASDEMPEFQVTLERDPENDGNFSVVEIKSLNNNSIGIGSNWYNLRLQPNPSQGGGFNDEKIYTITITALNGGWAAQQNGNARERLRVGIRNNHPSEARTYFGAAGNTELEAEVGFIKVLTSPIDFGEVLIGLDASEVLPEQFDIINVGTGDLTINNIGTPGIAAFTHQGVAAGTKIHSFNKLPAPLDVSFNPSHSSVTSSGPGLITTTMSVSSNSANVDSTITPVVIKALGIKLELALLYDISGSMTWTPDGNNTNIDSETRIYAAKQAGAEIQQILNGLEGDAVRVGLFTFPKFDVNCPSAFEKISLKEYNINVTDFNTAWGTGVNSLQGDPGGGTPMAEGLKRVYDIGFSDNPVSGKWTRGEYVHRALLLLSDGYHQCNSAPPFETPSDWVTHLTNDIPEDEKIRIFTIAFGDASNGTQVDYGTLQSLASATWGGMYEADTLGLSLLNKKFTAALIDWVDWANIIDPEGSITKGGQTQSHDVCIDDSITRIAFIVDWGEMVSSAVNFSLWGPDGMASTSSPDVSFHSGDNFALYIVKGQTAKGHEGSDKWTFKLSAGSGLNNGECVEYRYSVIGKSKVKLDTKFTWDILHTGNKPLIELKVKGLYKKLAKSASVTLKYTIPNESHGTWLSNMKGFEPKWLVPPKPPIIGKNNVPESSDITLSQISPENTHQANKTGELAQHIKQKQYVPEAIMGEPASMVQRKAYALKNFANTPFKNLRSNGSIQLYDNGENGDKVVGDGIYSAYLPTMKYDGLAKFDVFLESNSDDDCLKRELRRDKYIRVSLAPELLVNQLELKNFEITPFFPPDLPFQVYPKDGIIRKNIVFTPKDSFGNYWGPGHAQEVKFNVKNAESLGYVVDNLDGSYIQVIEYRKGNTPVVSVTARDVTSPEIKMKTAPSINFGIKAGLNFANLSASNMAPVFDWNNKTGFCLGAFLTLNLSDYFALQPEVFFSRKGLKEEQTTTTNTFNIDFIEVPLLFKFLPTSTGSISPSLFAGPFAAFKINDNITLNSNLPGIKSLDFGITFGAGVDIAIGSSGRALVFDARYTRGLINIADVPTGSNMTVKSKVLSFMMGLEF